MRGSQRAVGRATAPRGLRRTHYSSFGPVVPALGRMEDGAGANLSELGDGNPCARVAQVTRRHLDFRAADTSRRDVQRRAESADPDISSLGSP